MGEKEIIGKSSSTNGKNSHILITKVVRWELMKLCERDNPYRKWMWLGVVMALMIYQCSEEREQVEFMADLLVLMGGILFVLSYE